MNDAYTREERIAIRMCSGMTEREAIKLTDTEGREPDFIEKLKRLQERQKMERAERALKRGRIYSHDK